MIDNFNIIEEKLLNFTKGDYYKFEAIIRNKDGENRLATNPNSTSIKFWLIDSKESYDKLKPIMKEFCNITKARLYITLDKKSIKKTFVNTLKTLTETIGDIIYGSEYSVNKLNKIIASETSKKENTANNTDNKTRTWLLDIDSREDYIEKGVKKFCDNNYICTLNTPNGYHIVSKKNFGKDRFKDCLETFLLQNWANKYLETKSILNLVNEALRVTEIKENALGLVYIGER